MNNHPFMDGDPGPQSPFRSGGRPETLAPRPGGGPRARWVDGMGLTADGYGVAPIASRTAWAILVAESRLFTAGSRLVRTMTEVPVS